MNSSQQYDVIIIGGGHAGAEAAMASARMGASTLLLTHNIETLGQMSCNPAIGGIGKGHLVKEIDALGGVMARAIDHAGIQFRILNARKGPAVRATRAQADRMLYKQTIRWLIENQHNLTLFQQAVDDFIVKGEKVIGVITLMGLRFYAKTIVLTVGTFLRGKIHIGETNYHGGRASDPPSLALAEQLCALPFRVGRLKTGTPPRLDGRTIDYSQLSEQPGDEPVPVFSFMGNAQQHPQQVNCHITYTNKKTHEIIANNFHRSPMFTGAIDGIGPRYCPSIEDKVKRFADKDRHQIFIEPEGLRTHEIYPNGISTSLPFDVQVDFIHSIKGFERAHIVRPGYAIEYDYFDPRDLKPTLETKSLENLFFAGQINGTTGYEEAAAQGLIAGLNAALKAQEKKPWYPTRDQAYIGVLIDDLITCGTQEPYRMFTSRAEYRLILREDNADMRLTEIAHHLGLVDEAQWKAFCVKREAIAQETQRLRNIFVPDYQCRALELLKRPDFEYNRLVNLPAVGKVTVDSKVTEQIQIREKYDGYIKRQQLEIAKRYRYEHNLLPANIDYDRVVGLSHEVRQKLITVRPTTIGQASRIPGITPAAISVLLVHLKRLKY